MGTSPSRDDVGSEEHLVVLDGGLRPPDLRIPQFVGLKVAPRLLDRHRGEPIGSTVGSVAPTAPVLADCAG